MSHDNDSNARQPGLLSGLLAAAVVLVFLAGGSTATAQESVQPEQPDIPETGDDSSPDEKQEAPDRDKLREKLVFQLSGYHYFPSRSDLDELGKPSVISELLRQLAEDETKRPSMRLRAVDALGLYEDGETREYLVSLLDEPNQKLDPPELRVAGLMRHHAIVSLAKAHRGDAADTLAPLLEDDDVQLRLTVVSALAKHGDEAGTDALEAFRPKASHKLVERELDKYLGTK